MGRPSPSPRQRTGCKSRIMLLNRAARARALARRGSTEGCSGASQSATWRSEAATTTSGRRREPDKLLLLAAPLSSNPESSGLSS
mmetsp:Transcript_83998/g.270610  ORF Transcript_83998/g.270610 Transcript_83998/m.270610 type:complete len:85 (+) Transcript_83998:60-314(+)